MGVPGTESSVLGGAAGQSSGGGAFYDYQIEYSARFDAADTSYMKHDRGSPTNSDKATISAWVKRGLTNDGAGNSTHYKWAGAGYSSSGGDYGMIGFNGGTSDVFELYDYPSSNLNYKTNAKYRDTTGWYHFHLKLDTTQASSSDRIKIYVNGVEVTSFGSSNTPSQNADLVFNTSGRTFYVGSAGDTNNNPYQPYDGLIAEFIFVDGTAYDYTQFGEFKNGIWKPVDPSGTTFGNNGFHLKFGNSGSLGTDSSGNSNNFTVANMGADHQEQDTPTFGE